jgi:hypothetical protein
MTMDYDPIYSLEAVGYLEREAAFLYLVAVHSGYFLRRQYAQFIKRDSGALATRFLAKAARLNHLRIIECGQGTISITSCRGQCIKLSVGLTRKTAALIHQVPAHGARLRPRTFERAGVGG